MPAQEMTCSQLADAAVGSGTLRRFVLGVDKDGPREFTSEELESELNDRVGTLLKSGLFPSTAQELFDALVGGDANGLPSENPDSLRSFVVSETSQVMRGSARRRFLRFLVASARGEDGPDIVVSTAAPGDPSVEVMSWDPKNAGFNFYRTAGEPGAWVWAGNSRHALEAESRGQGPFEAHPAGSFLMKELKRPWVHWHSPDAPMDDRDLPADSGLGDHPWFSARRGAYELEESNAKPAVIRWNRERVKRIRAGEEDPILAFEQIVGAPADHHPPPAANLVSSMRSWSEIEAGESVSVPRSFFADADSLSVLGLEGPPALELSPAAYIAEIDSQGVTLSDGGDFTQARDTHFAFLVPERAFEDVDLLRQLLAAELLVDRRLAICLLLVDFSNPIFSAARAELLSVIRDFSASPDLGAGSFAPAIGDHIAAGEGAGAVAAFRDCWLLDGEQLDKTVAGNLQNYYAALQDRLATDAAAATADWLRLARARRIVHEKRLHTDEFGMTFARSASFDGALELRMETDGRVA